MCTTRCETLCINIYKDLCWAFIAWLMWQCAPAGVMTAIAFVHNLLRRHPACTVLLHAPSSTAAVAQAPSADATEHINAASARQDAPAALMSEQPTAGSRGIILVEGRAAKKRKKAPEQDSMQPGCDSAGRRHLAAPSESVQAPCNGASAAEAEEQGVQAQGSASGQQQSAARVDVYSVTEDDPAKSRAIESSLWEVEALRNHYCPQVSAFEHLMERLTQIMALKRLPFCMRFAFRSLKE